MYIPLTPGTCVDTFWEHTHTKSSNGYHVTDVWTLEACKAACRDRTFDKCAFLDYYEDDETCYLHNEKHKLAENIQTMLNVSQFERFKCNVKGRKTYAPPPHQKENITKLEILEDIGIDLTRLILILYAYSSSDREQSALQGMLHPDQAA